MASEMVMAYGDSGLESTPANEFVEIPVLQFARHPVTGGNVGVPATIRSLYRGERKPVRLTGISVKNQPWPYLSWRDAEGRRGGCYVRDSLEACDPLFDLLNAKSRARIVAAVASLDASESRVDVALSMIRCINERSGQGHAP